MFNKAIMDNSSKDNIREIDAVILSKFDTVDDKGTIWINIMCIIIHNSWSCIVTYVRYRQTHHLLWSWIEIYTSQETQC